MDNDSRVWITNARRLPKDALDAEWRRTSGLVAGPPKATSAMTREELLKQDMIGFYLPDQVTQ